MTKRHYSLKKWKQKKKQKPVYMSNIYNMHQYLLLKDSKVRENKYLKFKILTSFQYMLQLTYFRGGKITEII